MEKKLNRQFIAFSMIVITSVLSVFFFVIMLGGKNRKPPAGFLFIILLAIFMTYIASKLLARYALKPIKKTWQQQLDFTADASHELRTPLAVIQTNVELVLGNENESVASQQRWLKNIQEEALRMNILVENLLTLSRSDTNNQNLDCHFFPLDEIIQHAITPLLPIAKAKNILIQFHLHAESEFYGDKERIVQLCIILIDNALKYMGRAGTISISTKIEKDHLILIVEDDGHGIIAEELPHIFHRFYRSDEARNDGGSGLGLPIAQWIVSAHGGTIKAHSIPNVTTSFTIQLPIK